MNIYLFTFIGLVIVSMLVLFMDFARRDYYDDDEQN
jgi:hypothetical protein